MPCSHAHITFFLLFVCNSLLLFLSPIMRVCVYIHVFIYTEPLLRMVDYMKFFHHYHYYYCWLLLINVENIDDMNLCIGRNSVKCVLICSQLIWFFFVCYLTNFHRVSLNSSQTFDWKHILIILLMNWKQY